MTSYNGNQIGQTVMLVGLLLSFDKTIYMSKKKCAPKRLWLQPTMRLTESSVSCVYSVLNYR
jgi:hypothetical protein